MTSVIILGILAGIMYLSVLLIEKFINQKNHILNKINKKHKIKNIEQGTKADINNIYTYLDILKSASLFVREKIYEINFLCVVIFYIIGSSENFPII